MLNQISDAKIAILILNADMIYIILDYSLITWKCYYNCLFNQTLKVPLNPLAA